MIRHTLEIRATPDELFRLTQNYDRRLAWDPFLKTASLLGEAKEAGVGVVALCVSQCGFTMETEYVSFRPPFVAAVTMTRGPRFISRIAGSWRFEKIDLRRTRVTFQYQVEGGPRWAAWLMTPLLNWIFSCETRRRLLGLQQYVASQ